MLLTAFNLDNIRNIYNMFTMSTKYLYRIKQFSGMCAECQDVSRVLERDDDEILAAHNVVDSLLYPPVHKSARKFVKVSHFAWLSVCSSCSIAISKIILYLDGSSYFQFWRSLCLKCLLDVLLFQTRLTRNSFHWEQVSLEFLRLERVREGDYVVYTSLFLSYWLCSPARIQI